LSILTLNIQSLPAKFTEFSEWISFLQLSKSEPDIICLREIWQFPDHTLFNLPGYNELMYKSRRNNVQGGGVGIYVKLGLTFNLKPQLSIFVDRVFESIFIEVQPASSPKFFVGSVYRPSNNPLLTATEQFAQFSDLFSNLCNELSSLSNNSYICGDTNLDVLQYGSNTNTTDYVNLLFSYGFIQTITNPTRISNNSATLIDHVLTNSTSSLLESVIITTKISDHFPIIHFRKNSKLNCKPKFIETRDFSQTNVDRFITNLNNVDWNPITTELNPQITYNNFSDLFFNLYDIHFPLQRIKLNRNCHRIEKWITTGILVSRLEKKFDCVTFLLRTLLLLTAKRLKIIEISTT
jgi:hypothetical protein